MATSRTLARVIGLLASLASAACFGYAPVEPGAVSPGAQVRVHLTRAALLELPDVRPSVRAPTVVGTLRAQDDRVTVLFVPEGVMVEGAMQRAIGQEIAVPTPEIIQVEQRQFRTGRTVLAVAGGAGALAFLAASVRGARKPVELPPDPGPQEYRVPIYLSVPIGR